MINAAEEIVAERGFSAMTMREVHARSGQSNKSAAQYHFGSREGIVAAVVEARMKPVNEARRQFLADNDIGHADIRTLVEAVIVPLAQVVLCRPRSTYARFLVQCMTEPTLVQTIYDHPEAASVREVMAKLVERSRLPKTIALQRVTNMTYLVAAALAQLEGDLPSPADLPELIADIVDSCVGLLDAPHTGRIPRPFSASPEE